MFQELHAIVLYATKYPKGYVVNCYTRECGRLAVVTRGGSGHRSALRRVLLQPLSLVEMEVTQDGKDSLYRAVEGVPTYVYSSLPYDYVKNTIGLFLADFLSEVLRDEQRDEELFDFIEYSFHVLDEEKVGVANFHLAFMVQLLSFLGIAPNMAGGGSTYFDLVGGEYVQSDGTMTVLSGEALRRFEQLMRMDYENMREAKLQRVDRVEMLRMLMEYYELHLQLHLNVRSLEVLHGLF